MTMPMANAKKKTFAEKADKRRAKDVKASTTSSSPIGSLKTLPYCVSYSVATLNAKLQMTFPKYTHLNLWRHYLLKKTALPRLNVLTQNFCRMLCWTLCRSKKR
jgi:hypothetical protein